MAWIVSPSGDELEGAEEKLRLIEQDDSGAAIIVGRLGECAYLYSTPLDAQERHKLDAMLAYPISRLEACQFCWPTDAIENEEGETVGFVGSCAPNAVALNTVVAPSSQYAAAGASPIPFYKRIAIAKNLCVALGVFHSCGLYFGNLTAASVLVNLETCRVFLNPVFDVRIRDERGGFMPTFRYAPEYLPPEYSRDHVRADVSWDTLLDADLFALGVIVFGLLHGGRHPLSCVVGGNDNVRNLGDVPPDGILVTYDAPPSRLQAYFTSIAMGIRSDTSYDRHDFGVPAFRRPWLRPVGMGPLFDGCFLSLARRPDERKWYEALDKLSGGARALASRLADDMQDYAKKRHAEGTSTDPSERRTLLEQYPQDSFESEPYTSRRVFWRTTGLFAIGTALSIACMVKANTGWAPAWALASFICGGAFLGTLFANGVAGKQRGAVGYRPCHYAASFICCVLAALASAACLAALGGVW